MHLRQVTSTSNGKTYRYAQLVESFRRDDGKPAVRVVRHLGKLPDSVFDAFRIALEASRNGDTLVLRSEVAELLSGSTLANLRYLDLAVLIDCWHQWELSKLLDEIAGKRETAMSFSETVLPLVLQRCSAPGSKLEATRWVPTTALPEVIGFQLGAFHNSRIHRSLETLYEVTGSLQQRLCEKYSSRHGNVGVLFMDVTDTYFEGIGCPAAERTKTKTEMPHKRCLGVVLLANEIGYPMRWKVVGGKTKDWHAMGGLLDDIGEVEWLKKRPVIFDRAMGNQKNVAALKSRKELHFLTAAHVTAIESYTKDLPYSVVTDVEIEGTDASYEKDIERVAQAARKAGFEQIDSRLFAIELGVTVPASEQEKAKLKAKEEQDPAGRRRPGRPVLAAKHLRHAHEIRREMKADESLTKAAMAASLGITTGHLSNQLALLELAPVVQERILQWNECFPFGEKYLRSLLPLSPEEQLADLDEKLAAHMSAVAEPAESKEDDTPIGLLRLVAYFNPQLFVDVRRRTAEHCEKLERHVEAFNADLAVAQRTRSYESTYRKFAHEVERLKYLDTFDIELTPITVTSKTKRKIASFQGSITRKEDAWKRRRRYDGFVLLLGHPELPHSAKELVRFYRIKDTVEKDFQTIKSVIKLRPIYSYTDPKVQAHVTLCMLALLLHRTLEHKLSTAGLGLTAPACIDILKTCHLNQRRSDDEPMYDVTQLNAAQQQVLSALGLERLADDGHLRARVTPRRLPVTPSAPSKRGRRPGPRASQ